MTRKVSQTHTLLSNMTGNALWMTFSNRGQDKSEFSAGQKTSKKDPNYKQYLQVGPSQI